jgi:hypothetical protein
MLHDFSLIAPKSILLSFIMPVIIKVDLSIPLHQYLHSGVLNKVNCLLFTFSQHKMTEQQQSHSPHPPPHPNLHFLQFKHSVATAALSCTGRDILIFLDYNVLVK